MLAIFGKGFGDPPTWPAVNMDNGSGTGSTTYYGAELTKFGMWPHGGSGSWQSPSIPITSGKQLKNVVIKQSYGDDGAKGIPQVNILRASDDVVLSSWTPISPAGDTTINLSASDFNNGLDITNGVNIKIEVWLSSVDGGSWSEISEISGDIAILWTPQETLGLSEQANAETDMLLEESLGLADKTVIEFDTLLEETLGLSEQDIAVITAILFETIGLNDSESIEIDTLISEILGLSESVPESIEILFSETLALADTVGLDSLSMAGIKALIVPLLDITDAGFCSTVQESGQVVIKKGTPDEEFRAFFFKKQSSQSFDIGIKINPGDAVMFYCPQTETAIAIGDHVEHDFIEYEIIAELNKFHDGNLIYTKFACRMLREFGGEAIPDIENLAATVNDDGSVLVSWEPVSSADFPWVSKYQVFISDDDVSYSLYRETTSPSITASGLTPLKTYYFKVRATSIYGNEGNLSAAVNTELPALDIPIAPLVTIGDNKDGNVAVTWAEIDPQDFPSLNNYAVFRDEESFSIVTINHTANWIEFAGDQTRFFYIGQTIRISATGYDGDFTVTAIAYDAPGASPLQTRISVVETIPLLIVGGSIISPDELLTITSAVSTIIKSLEANAEYLLKVRGIDIYGRYGTDMTGLACNTDLNENEGATPQNLVAVGAAGEFATTWDEIETAFDPEFDYYELWFRLGTGTWRLATETSGLSHTQKNLAAGTYEVKIRWISKKRNYSNYSTVASAIVT